MIYNGPEGLRGWGAALMGVILGEDGEDVGGIVVTEVMAESPAFKSGMQIGDIVTHINGKAFQNRAAMIRHVKGHMVGDKLKVEVIRGDAKKELKVGLAALHWRFEDGALVTDRVGSMIGRELKWPKKADLSFDFSWNTMPAMDVIICADKVREYNAINGYKLQIYQNYAHLYRNTSPDGVSYNTTSLGTVTVRWSNPRKANIRLLVNQNKAAVSMLIDGKLVKTWKDPRGGFVGGGGALGFNPKLAGKMKISAIQLKNWSGQIPNVGGNPQIVAGTTDQLQFGNGDSLSGAIISIKEAKVSVKTPFAEVPIPLENVSTIIFSNTEKEEKKPTGARFILGGVGRLTGDLLEWNEEGVRIKSPLFGGITVDPAVITSVQFR